MTKRRSFSTLLLRYCQLYILILFLVPTSTAGVYPLPKSNGPRFVYNAPTHGYRYLLNKIANKAKDAHLIRLMHDCIQNPKCRQTLYRL